MTGTTPMFAAVLVIALAGVATPGTPGTPGTPATRADDDEAPRRAPGAYGLEPLRLYCGAGRSIPMTAHAPAGAEVVDLVLMDAAGQVLAAPRSTAPGGFDLDALMEAAAEIVGERRAACYLQMLVDEEPVGAALVLQPMLSRMVPLTDTARRDGGGQAYTRVAGWQSEAEPATGAEPDAAPPAANGEGEATPPVRVLTGLRVYVEHDVLLETSFGPIVIALRPDEAPNTAWNFRHLAGGGFYDGVIFHRVVPTTRDGDPFVIQAGDPSGSGEGGPGYWLPLEPSGLAHDFGVISMARADDPDSAGSQFFVCLSRRGTARLDGQYCAFGYAVDGAETIVALSEVELADVARGRPADPPLIQHATLVPAPPRRPGRGRPDQRVEPPVVTLPPRPARVPR